MWCMRCPIPRSRGLRSSATRGDYSFRAMCPARLPVPVWTGTGFMTISPQLWPWPLAARLSPCLGRNMLRVSRMADRQYSSDEWIGYR